jgi:hypothetical protein
MYLLNEQAFPPSYYTPAYTYTPAYYNQIIGVLPTLL